MKKIVILSAFLLIAMNMVAQDYTRSIGLRIGSSIGASYKEFIRPATAIEGVLDLDILDDEKMKLKLSGFYQFHFNVDVDGLSLYAGPGASAGIYVGDESGFMMSVDGIGGVEYKFHNAPIALSFDWNPKVQIINDAGFKPDNFGLTIRYTL
jgi:hypothetical protein